MYCHEDDALAEARHVEYGGRLFVSNVDHYEMAGEHFATTKGYERYAESAQTLRAAGLEKAAQNYAATTLWGSPSGSSVRSRRSATWSATSSSLQCAYGGMPYGQARASLELFAREVMPKARGMRVERVAASS